MAVHVLTPKCEIDFCTEALRGEGIRIDGRAANDFRRLGIRFGPVHGEVEVNFGATRAMSVCSGEVVAPGADRPNEGRIAFNVEFGPIASPSFEPGRPSVQATSVANSIERLLRGSHAVDTEALCIVGGKKVWSIRVDIRALDDDGNLRDVCAVAALCSLMHFRKADVEVKGTEATIFAEEERVPVPLSIHHLPVPVTFALFPPAPGKGLDPICVADPTRLEEEAAVGGMLTVAVNQHGELCGAQKPGGMPVDFALLQHCIQLATARCKDLTARIQASLEADLAKRKEARRNVRRRFDANQLLNVEL